MKNWKLFLSCRQFSSDDDDDLSSVVDRIRIVIKLVASSTISQIRERESKERETKK
jgi:hypothetical protein